MRTRIVNERTALYCYALRMYRKNKTINRCTLAKIASNVNKPFPPHTNFNNKEEASPQSVREEEKNKIYNLKLMLSCFDLAEIVRKKEEKHLNTSAQVRII